MVINRAYRFRIYPNREQEMFFAKTFGCVRFFYNRSLSDMRKIYEEQKRYEDITPASYKAEFEFLKEVDSLALANAQLNRNKAFKAFFRGQNKFPKFKSKRNRQSYSTNNQNGTVHLSEDNRYISLPKAKNIRIKLHRRFSGLIKTATIIKECDDKYYVSMLVQEEIKAKERTDKVVGIDLGIKSFLVDSNANVVDNPKHINKSSNKLAKEQRKLSLMKGGSNNYNKQRIKVARIHSKIKNQRNDFLHKLSSKMIRENQIIVSEDLSVLELEQNQKIARLIADASWSTFLSYLEYKASWYGRELIKVESTYPSSQLCSCCGYKNVLVKSLSVRTWVCPECHAKHDRDYNASVNILKRGFEMMKARTSPDSLLILESLDSLSKKPPLL